MTPDEIIDPLRPMQHLSDTLRNTLHPHQGGARDIAPEIPILLGTYRWMQGSDPAAPILTRDLVSLCDYLDALAEAEPEAIHLADAPRIDRWCAAVIADLPVLVGLVTGHPRLRQGARTVTSPLVRIAPDQGWARTLSRYYQLGRPDQSVFTALLAEGRLHPGALRFDIPDLGGWT
jgi:hypothetical protein